MALVRDLIQRAARDSGILGCEEIPMQIAALSGQAKFVNH